VTLANVIGKSKKPTTVVMIVTAVVGCTLWALMLVSCTGSTGFVSQTDAETADAAATVDEASADSSFAALDGSGVQEDIGFAMGTVVYQTLYTSDAALPATVLDILIQTEEQRFAWREETSDIARINAQLPGDEPARISYETREALLTALAIAADSGGAFDPTVGQLTQLWNFDDGSNTVPSDTQIQDVLKSVGYEGVLIQGDTVTLQSGASLDFGAVGKGIGCDQVLQLLTTRADVKGAVINFGGSSILTYGERGDGRSWKVAITNPTQTDDYLGVLNLVGTHHLSTTGNYERYFEIDGQRYHHILDPDTGYPAQTGLQSVTVVCDSGIISEGLSTACFVLGREKSTALLNKYGVEAIFVDNQNRVYLTAGLKDEFELLAEGYEVVEQ
jgi:thiamine biosynthesis lipoprotein